MLGSNGGVIATRHGGLNSLPDAGHNTRHTPQTHTHACDMGMSTDTYTGLGIGKNTKRLGCYWEEFLSAYLLLLLLIFPAFRLRKVV